MRDMKGDRRGRNIKPRARKVATPAGVAAASGPRWLRDAPIVSV